MKVASGVLEESTGATAKAFSICGHSWLSGVKPCGLLSYCRATASEAEK